MINVKFSYSHIIFENAILYCHIASKNVTRLYKTSQYKPIKYGFT